MTLEWIGDVVLLVVLLPVVIYLLNGVLRAANSIVPSVNQISAAAQAASKDLDAAPLLLLNAGPGQANRRGGRRLWRLSRQDRRRRVRRSD